VLIPLPPPPPVAVNVNDFGLLVLFATIVIPLPATRFNVSSPVACTLSLTLPPIIIGLNDDSELIRTSPLPRSWTANGAFANLIALTLETASVELIPAVLVPTVNANPTPVSPEPSP